MGAIILTFLFFYIISAESQDVYSVTPVNSKVIQLCDVCTCSEIPDSNRTHLVLNIECSELDRIENVPDLNKMEWPINPNGLRISATFEGLALSTLSKLLPNNEVETLKFNNNAIKTYWPDPFSDIPNLKKLSFAHNDLIEISPDLFTKIDQLQDLDLSYNKLVDFSTLDFKCLLHLKRLNLQGNQLKMIPLEALQPLLALEDLDMSKNGIYDLLLQRSETNALGRVKRLNLSGNRIRSVMKDSFTMNNSIELLDLSSNMIEIVEEDSFLTCTNLKELNLAQNNITLVFVLPSPLQILILKDNLMFHWPVFPKGITYIDLSYNKLSKWYDEGSVDFDLLEVLNVGGNQIKELDMKKKLPKLCSLDLSYNRLIKIPEFLSNQNLPNLEELRLDGNPITTIYFKSLLTLKSLYMNDLNDLVTIEDKAFTNVAGQDRSGDGNEKKCFSLYLSNCRSLSDIQDGAFYGTSLCMLDISRNNLSRLSKDLLEWTSLDDGVNLQWNPWDCSCSLQWILDELLPLLYKRHSRLLAELRCASPRAFEGLRLVHWYNWTGQAMCRSTYSKSGSHDAYLLEPSTEFRSLEKLSSSTVVLGGAIIIFLLIAIILTIYLIKGRKRHRIRQSALRRKRQSVLDCKNSNGMKEQISALNKP